MRRALLLVGAVALALSCCACAQSGGATVTLRDSDERTVAELRVGDQLVVELMGNPTTGLTWDLAAVDETILKGAGLPGFKSGGAQLDGAGAFRFTFKAVAPGRTELALVYHRPFRRTPPEKTWQVVVLVVE